MMDIKMLVVTNEPTNLEEIENILSDNIKEIIHAKFDNDALISYNLFVYDVILVYVDASSVMKKDFFVNKLQNYKRHIPIIILVAEDDSKYIKSISNLPGVDFCLAFNFHKNILIELLYDCIHTVFELKT